MADAYAGRDHVESAEALHAPFQEPVPGVIALDFHVQVQLQGFRAAEIIHLHGMIDDQVHGNQRLDDAGFAAQTLNGGAHRGKVDQQGNAGKILQQDARHHERHLIRPHRFRTPVRQPGDILFTDALPVAVAQDGFKQDADAEGQPGNRPYALFFKLRQRIQFTRPSARQREMSAAIEIDCVSCEPQTTRYLHIQPFLYT